MKRLMMITISGNYLGRICIRIVSAGLRTVTMGELKESSGRSEAVVICGNYIHLDNNRLQGLTRLNLNQIIYQRN